MNFCQAYGKRSVTAGIQAYGPESMAGQYRLFAELLTPDPPFIFTM